MYCIEHYYDHYVIKDESGDIIIHCDSYKEAKEEIKELEENYGEK